MSAVDEYVKEQESKRKAFLDKFETYKDELDRLNISELEKAKLVRKFLKNNKTYKTKFIKYNNFILDVRKPSFGMFVFFVFCSIYGLINIIKYIISLLF